MADTTTGSRPETRWRRSSVSQCRSRPLVPGSRSARTSSSTSTTPSRSYPTRSMPPSSASAPGRSTLARSADTTTSSQPVGLPVISGGTAVPTPTTWSTTATSTIRCEPTPRSGPTGSRPGSAPTSGSRSTAGRAGAQVRPGSTPTLWVGGGLGAPAAEPGILLGRGEPPGLLHRAEDRPGIERDQASDVGPRRLDVHGGKPLRRIERPGNHGGQGDDSAILAVSKHPGGAEPVDVLSVGHLAFDAVERFLLEEQHRVGIADGGGEQALRVGGV